MTRVASQTVAGRWQNYGSVSRSENRIALVPHSERRLRDVSSEVTAKGAEWYVRLKLRQDLLGKLWVRNMMPHDVLVWSGEHQNWVPLGKVPRLRDYVTSMTREWQAGRSGPLLADPARAGGVSPPRQLGAPAMELPRDVVFRPTGPAARHLASTIPPPVHSASAPPIPRAPRIPAFEDLLAEHTQAAAWNGRRHPAATSSRPDLAAALTHTSVVPLRTNELPITEPPPATQGRDRIRPLSSLPPPRTLTVAPPLRHRAKGRLDYVERAVWMVAGVATMFAIMAAFGKIQRSDLWGGPASASSVRLIPRVVSAAMSGPLEGAHRFSEKTVKDAPAPEPVAATAQEAEVTPEEEDATVVASRWVARRRSVGLASSSPRAPKKVEATPTTLVEEGNDTAAEPSERAPSTDAAPAAAPSGLGSFDRSAARRALAGAAVRASKCADGAAQGTVVVTYASSGLVQNVAVASVSGDGVSAGCIVRTFQSARIPPYFGGSVTVSKSFSLK